MDYNQHPDALRRQLQQLTDLMRELIFLLEHVSEEDFRQNEELRERSYYTLQEIGQTALEMDHTIEPDDHMDLPLQQLTALANAQYNQEQEFAHRQVYYLIKNDFPVMREEIQKMLDKYIREG